MAKDNEVSNLKDDDITKNSEGEVYRKFLRLYDRFTADRLVVSKQGEVLGKIIDELKSESSLTAELKIQIRQDIAETMKEVVKEINEQIKKSVQDSITVGIGDSIKEFKSALDSSSALRSTSEKEPTKPWDIVVLFLCITSFICIVYTAVVVGRHIPGSYFTGDQIATYRDGIFMDRLWNKLSKKERERLMAIESGKLLPEENSFAWIAKQNPGMNSEGIRKKIEEQKE